MKWRDPEDVPAAVALREQAEFLRQERAKREARLTRLLLEQLPPSAIRERMGEAVHLRPDVEMEDKALRARARRLGRPLRSEDEQNWAGVA